MARIWGGVSNSRHVFLQAPGDPSIGYENVTAGGRKRRNGVMLHACTKSLSARSTRWRAAPSPSIPLHRLSVPRPRCTAISCWAAGVSKFGSFGTRHAMCLGGAPLEEGRSSLIVIRCRGRSGLVNGGVGVPRSRETSRCCDSTWRFPRDPGVSRGLLAAGRWPYDCRRTSSCQHVSKSTLLLQHPKTLWKGRAARFLNFLTARAGGQPWRDEGSHPLFRWMGPCGFWNRSNYVPIRGSSRPTEKDAENVGPWRGIDDALL